jgi:hypothetical protein
MFVTRKPILILHVSGHTIRTTADHPFFVPGRGWTSAAALRAGDQLRTPDGQNALIEAITDHGEKEVVYQMDARMPPFPCSGLWPAGTLLETADGLKPIADIQPGDGIVVRDPLDPERN